MFGERNGVPCRARVWVADSNPDADKSLRGNMRRCQYAEKFLSGETTYTPSMIIHAWFHSPYGAVSPGSEDEKLMYTTTTEYIDIKPLRPALSSFAAQVVREKLLKEATNVTKPVNGLHTSRKESRASRCRSSRPHPRLRLPSHPCLFLSPSPSPTCSANNMVRGYAGCTLAQRHPFL